MSNKLVKLSPTFYTKRLSCLLVARPKSAPIVDRTSCPRYWRTIWDVVRSITSLCQPSIPAQIPRLNVQMDFSSKCCASIPKAVFITGTSLFILLWRVVKNLLVLFAMHASCSGYTIDFHTGFILTG